MPATVKHVFTNPVADGTITSIVRPSDWNSAHVVTLAPTGAEIIGAFSNGGNVTFGTNASGYVTASAPAGGTGGGGVAISAGTNSTSTGTVVFADSNGMSFGMNTNGAVTASYTVPNVPAQTEYVFSNSNNVSFGTNGSTVTATATFAQSVQPVAYSADNGSAAFSTLTFANSNGVSFSTGTQGLYATVKTDYQSQGAYLTTARASNDAVGLNTAVSNVTATINSSGLSLDGRGYAGTGTTTAGANVSFSVTLNSNGLNLSGSVSPGGAGDGYNSAQFTNSTANSTMPLLWAGNSNGSGNITFGLTGSTVTASAPTGGAGGAALQGSGTYTQNTGTIQFANSNGITFGLTNNQMTAAHNGITQQSTQPVAYSAGNGSAAFSTLKFADSQGVSFSTGTQGVYATVKTDYQSSNANYLTSQSNQAYSAANGSATFQTITFANSNGVSFSTGTQGLYASHNGITQQSTQPVAYSAANGSAAFSTLTFANSNGVSFSTGTQGLYASHNALTSQSNQAYSAANGSVAFQTITFANSNGVSFSTGTQGLYASHDGFAATGTTKFAGTGTTFAGANVSGSITLNSNGLNLSLSAPTPGGGGAINVSAGTTSNNLQTIQFDNANGVSFGLNGSTVTASVNAGGGGAKTLSYFDVLQGEAAGATVGMSSRVSQASTIWLFPLDREGFPGDMTVQTAMFNVFNSGNTNSISAALTYTWGLGVYQVTDVTRLTLIRKASSVWTQSANANYSQSLVGQRWLTFHSTQFSNATGGAANLELSAGGRYVGALSVSSAGSAIQTHNFLGEYLYSTNARSGMMGALSQTNTSQGFYPWLGQFSATSTAFPNSIGVNQINRQVASGNFRPHLVFNNISANL